MNVFAFVGQIAQEYFKLVCNLIAIKLKGFSNMADSIL